MRTDVARPRSVPVELPHWVLLSSISPNGAAYRCELSTLPMQRRVKTEAPVAPSGSRRRIDLLKPDQQPLGACSLGLQVSPAPFMGRGRQPSGKRLAGKFANDTSRLMAPRSLTPGAWEIPSCCSRIAFVSQMFARSPAAACCWLPGRVCLKLISTDLSCLKLTFRMMRCPPRVGRCMTKLRLGAPVQTRVLTPSKRSSRGGVSHKRAEVCAVVAGAPACGNRRPHPWWAAHPQSHS